MTLGKKQYNIILFKTTKSLDCRVIELSNIIMPYMILCMCLNTSIGHVAHVISKQEVLLAERKPWSCHNNSTLHVDFVLFVLFSFFFSCACTFIKLFDMQESFRKTKNNLLRSMSFPFPGRCKLFNILVVQ